MQVTILRGIPGSGKTTHVKSMGDHISKVSADDFFLWKYKGWRYVPTELAEAHKQCLCNFLECLDREDKHVVVDNTNTSAWEVAVYYQLATVYTTTIKVIRFYCDPIIAFNRNIHGVPLKQVLSMHQRLMTEQLPPWVQEEIIVSS